MKTSMILLAGLLSTPAATVTASVGKRYDHARIGMNGQVEEEGVWTRYDTVVLLHAICGFCAWQLVAPLGVLVAAVGRDWGPVWFHMHWQLHLLGTVPLTVAGVALGTVASKLGPDKGLDGHKIVGFSILALVWIQLGVGYWNHAKSKSNAEADTASSSSEKHLPVTKRKPLAYVHIVLGIVLLSLGGLQVTLGFREYTTKPIPHWIIVMHWVLVGLPVFTVGPFIIIRGYLRLRRGQTFAQAFFNAPPSPRYVPPRRLWLHESSYLEHADDGNEHKGDEDGEGFIYARGRGQGGAQPVSFGEESGWSGPATREEYEENLKKDGFSITTPSIYSSADGIEFGDDSSLHHEDSASLLDPRSSHGDKSDSNKTHSPQSPLLTQGPSLPRTPPPFPVERSTSSSSSVSSQRAEPKGLNTSFESPSAIPVLLPGVSSQQPLTIAPQARAFSQRASVNSSLLPAQSPLSRTTSGNSQTSSLDTSLAHHGHAEHALPDVTEETTPRPGSPSTSVAPSPVSTLAPSAESSDIHSSFELEGYLENSQEQEFGPPRAGVPIDDTFGVHLSTVVSGSEQQVEDQGEREATEQKPEHTKSEPDGESSATGEASETKLDRAGTEILVGRSGKI
ncbi:hypothetical protein T439DRAFT_354374 [Meredithblackwellia eburnea MCA 4105]